MDQPVSRRNFLRTAAALVPLVGLSACSGVSTTSILLNATNSRASKARLPPQPQEDEQRSGWINWDDGRPIQVQSGDTATCTGLHTGQLYCIFIYNTSGSDHDVTVTLVWSNAAKPEHLVVPGTRMDEGPASLIFVSGTDTATASISISGTSSSIECFIGSVGMPKNTLGLQSLPLHPIGQPEKLLKGYRYHSVLDNSWYEISFENEYTQSQIIQFSQDTATVFVVNPVTDIELNILAVGTVKEGTDYSIVKPEDGTQPQRIQMQYQGDGEQMVWISASSYSNARHTTITLQSLSASDPKPSPRTQIQPAVLLEV